MIRGAAEVFYETNARSDGAAAAESWLGSRVRTLSFGRALTCEASEAGFSGLIFSFQTGSCVWPPCKHPN